MRVRLSYKQWVMDTEQRVAEFLSDKFLLKKL